MHIWVLFLNLKRFTLELVDTPPHEDTYVIIKIPNVTHGNVNWIIKLVKWTPKFELDLYRKKYALS